MKCPCVSELLRAAILRAVDLGDPRHDAETDARLRRLAPVLVDEIERAPETPLHLPLPRDPRARRVALALRDDPGDPRRAADWARIAGASERTLLRLFHRELGMSFGAWRQQARLLRALEGLAGGASVTEVALTVGFASPSAFIAMFRRALGESPGRYFQGRKGA